MKVTKTKKTKRHVVPKSVRRKLRQNAKHKRATRQDKMAELRMTLKLSNKDTHIEYIKTYVGLVKEDITRISNAVNPAIQFLDEVTEDPKYRSWFEKNGELVNIFIDQVELVDKHITYLRRVRDESETALATFVATEFTTMDEMVQSAYTIILSAASVIEQSLIVDNQIVDLLKTIGDLDAKEIRGE